MKLSEETKRQVEIENCIVVIIACRLRGILFNNEKKFCFHMIWNYYKHISVL